MSAMPNIVISDTSCFCFISVNVWNEKFWKWPENSTCEGGYIISIQLFAEPQGAQAEYQYAVECKDDHLRP